MQLYGEKKRKRNAMDFNIGFNCWEKGSVDIEDYGVTCIQ